MSDTSDSSEFDGEGLSSLQFVSGRIEVGSKDDEDESMRQQVSFDYPFTEPPIVIVSAQGEGSYPDAFGATVINPSENGFEVNVGRQHNECQSWGQNLTVNYFAVVPRNTELLQAGVVDVGGHDNEDESIEVEIKFKPAFPKNAVPILMCSALGEDYPDCFSATLRRVTRKKAKVRIARTNPNCKTWGQGLKLNWVATTIFPSQRIEIGSKEEGDAALVVPGIEYPGKFKKKPTIFCITQHCSGSEFGDTFCATPCDVQKDNFQMNITRIHTEANGWGMDLRAHFVVIP